MTLRPLSLATLALLACQPSVAPLGPAAPIEPALRARLTDLLTSGGWTRGMSGSTTWHAWTTRYDASGRVEQRYTVTAAGQPFGTPARAATPDVGAWRLTDTGAVEQVLAGATTRETFVVAPDGHGGLVWPHAGYVALGADGRRFRRESARRTADGEGVEVECEVELSAPPPALDDATCTMQVRVRARQLARGRTSAEDALDVAGRCTVDRSGPLPRLAFEGFARTDPVQATAEWTNWLYRTGRRESAGASALADAVRGAFVPVLAYDPSAPDMLFAAYVAGLSRELPAIP